MFNKLSQMGKTLQDEISRNLNELNEDGHPPVSLKLLRSTAQALRNGRGVLGTATPEATEMVQPGDTEALEEAAGGVPEVVTPEIRALLRKFQKYEDKYPRLLEAYKVEKMKTHLIGQFEGVLREYTPVSSITEVGELVEHLEGLTRKTQLLNDEMRRLAGAVAEGKKEKQVDLERIAQLEQQLKDMAVDHHHEAASSAALGEEAPETTADRLALNEAAAEGLKIQLQESEKAVEAARKQVEVLEEAAAASLRAALTDAQAIAELEVSLTAAQAQNTTLVEKLATLTKTHDDTMAEVLVLQTEAVDPSGSAELTQQLAETTARCAAQELDLETERARVETLSQKVATMESDSKAHALLCQPADAAAPNNHSPVPLGAGKKKKNKGKAQAIVGGVAVLPEEHVKLEEERDALASERDAIQEASSILAEKLQVQLRVAATQREEIESLRDMLRDVGSDLVTARDAAKEQGSDAAKVALLEDRIAALETKLETAIREQNAAEERCSVAEAALLKAEAEGLALAQERDAKATAAAQVPADLTEAVRELEASLELKTTAVETLQTKLESHTQAIESLEQEKVVLTERVRDLERVKANDTTLKLEIATLKSSLDHRATVVANLEAQLEEREKEKALLVATIATLKVSEDELKVLQKTARAAHHELLSKYEEQRTAQGALEAKFRLACTEKAALATEVETLTETYEDLRASRSVASGVAEAAKRLSEELSMKLKEATERVEALEEELNETRVMLQERTRESATIRKLMMEGENSQDSRLRELNARLKAMEDERDELENDYGMAVKRKQREVDELTYMNETLKADHKQVTAELAKARDLALAAEGLERLMVAQSSTDSVDAIHESLEHMRESLRAANKKALELESVNLLLKKLNDESSLRFDRLSKNYTLVANQLKGLKAAVPVASVGESPSSSRKSSVGGAEAPVAASTPLANLAYVKNIVLGYLERKDQRPQLLPVMKTLLELDDEEEKRLTSALR